MYFIPCIFSFSFAKTIISLCGLQSEKITGEVIFLLVTYSYQSKRDNCLCLGRLYIRVSVLAEKWQMIVSLYLVLCTGSNTFNIFKYILIHFVNFNYLVFCIQSNKNLDISINASNNFNLNITWSIGSTGKGEFWYDVFFPYDFMIP